MNPSPVGVVSVAVLLYVEAVELIGDSLAEFRNTAGVVPQYATLGVAAWMAYVSQGRDVRGRELSLDDPMADRLRTAAAAGGGHPARLVDSLLRVREIFGEDLPEHDGFRASLVDHVARLTTKE